ncbi:unnamed protein product [Chrysoparadoxa australica]
MQLEMPCRTVPLDLKSQVFNQALGACTSPYSARCSLSVLPVGMVMPSGGFTYTSSSSDAFRNAVSTSNCSISQLCWFAVAKITLIVLSFTTGEKLSL